MYDKKKLEEIAGKLIGNADGEADTRNAPAKKQQSEPSLHLVVNGGSVGNVTVGGTHHHSVYHVEEVPKPVVVVQTGVGTIDARQKRRLLELRDDVVEASKAGTKQKTPGGVMLALNKYIKVNKYDEILATDFDKAVKWLIRQRAIKTSLRSAPKKLPDWRNRRIGAIHARCKEKGFEAWRFDYMKKKFGKESMIDLSDDDLETLYRAVMAKK